MPLLALPEPVQHVEVFFQDGVISRVLIPDFEWQLTTGLRVPRERYAEFMRDYQTA